MIDKESLKNLEGGVRQQVQKSPRHRLLFANPRSSRRDGDKSEESRNTRTEGAGRTGVDADALIDNFRVQRLLGILPKSGKATMENIPEWKDRSRFSCEKYQFFLKAPFEIGQRCCKVMKKEPFHRYQRETGRKGMTAQMAEESRLRQQSWIKFGCNAFDASEPKSNPMAFWTEQDVLQYIVEHDLRIAPVYGRIVSDTEVEGQMSLFDYDLSERTDKLKTTGCRRTGCVFCLYGIHLEEHPNRLEMLKETHPQLYAYIMKPETEGGLGYKEKLDWVNAHSDLDIKY